MILTAREKRDLAKCANQVRQSCADDSEYQEYLNKVPAGGPFYASMLVSTARSAEQRRQLEDKASQARKQWRTLRDKHQNWHLQTETRVLQQYPMKAARSGDLVGYLNSLGSLDQPSVGCNMQPIALPQGKWPENLCRSTHPGAQYSTFPF
jgi:hypothetical protein